MFSKLESIKKKYFLFALGIYLLFFFISEVYANSLMNNIICLFRESQELDKKIIKKMRFELFDTWVLSGDTEKYIFKSDNGDLWLFKTYSSPERIKISRAIYLLSQLLGISTPRLYEITLPINEKFVYGSIQKFITECTGLNKVPFNQLKKKQISGIQNCQILDWLILDNDSTADHFIIEPKTKELIIVDKDDSLRYVVRDSLGENPWNNSYYTKFWNAYVKGVIDVDFGETFDFIDYIQSINNNEFEKIFSIILNKKKLINEFFYRKKNLKTEFDNFRQKLLRRRKEQFQISAKSKEEKHLNLVLGKLKKTLLEKRKVLKKLESKRLTEQKNIVIVSSGEAWFTVKGLNYCSREKFLPGIEKILEKLKSLGDNTLNIYESLAINLYMEEVEKIRKKKDIENFLQNKIKRITIYPGQITDLKILNIEYDLRCAYGENMGLFSEYKKEIEINPHNVLLHLNYIQHPVEDKFDEEEQDFLKIYKEKAENSENDPVNKFVYGILSKDLDWLGKITDSFSWKYLGMALVCSLNRDREDAIEFCKEALIRNKGGLVTSQAYILLGLLYECNDKWERFGEGFDKEKSIEAYKKAIEIDPESIKAHLNMGILYLIFEKPDKALKEFKEVNKLDPQYGKEHFHIENINKKSSYKKKKKYLEAVKMNTLSGRHHYILGLAYLIKEDRDMAQRHFNKAKEFGYKINDKLELK